MAITLDRAEALAATTSGFDRLFWECVALIVRFAQATGLTYEAANILLFVVIHPLVTVALAALLVSAWSRNRRLRRQLASAHGVSSGGVYGGSARGAPQI